LNGIGTRSETAFRGNRMPSEKVTLVAQVVHARGRDGTVTNVLLKFGPLTLASATLAGQWNPEQALRELRKTRRYTLTADGERYEYLIGA
jgi:hypothetical protein